MLINLTPKNRFRSMMEQHTKYMNRGWEEHEKPRKFTELFIPTEYTGVYWSSLREYGIQAWTKQIPKVCTKKYKTDTQTLESMKSASYYGVADNIEQIINLYNTRDFFSGNHVILLTKVTKNPDEPFSGWRWHKWGEYIGTQNHKCEYLNDEPEIDEVICFSIYQVS